MNLARKTELCSGAFASILACPQHVRLRGNLGSAGCPILPVEGIGLDVIQATKREPRIMRYELTDFEWAAIRSFLPNKPRGIPLAPKRSLARPAGVLWSPHHLLQSPCPLAAGWCLGPDHGCAGRRSRRGRADDRYLDHARAPARSQHRGQQSPRYGSLTSVRFSSAPCCPKRCCWRIAVMMPIGSGSLLASREHGRTFRRNEIAKTRSASARISIGLAIWSNGSSTRSNTAAGLPRAMTSSLEFSCRCPVGRRYYPAQLRTGPR